MVSATTWDGPRTPKKPGDVREELPGAVKAEAVSGRERSSGAVEKTPFLPQCLCWMTRMWDKEPFEACCWELASPCHSCRSCTEL